MFLNAKVVDPTLLAARDAPATAPAAALLLSHADVSAIAAIW